MGEDLSGSVSCDLKSHEGVEVGEIFNGARNSIKRARRVDVEG